MGLPASENLCLLGLVVRGPDGDGRERPGQGRGLQKDQEPGRHSARIVPLGLAPTRICGKRVWLGDNPAPKAAR